LPVSLKILPNPCSGVFNINITGLSVNKAYKLKIFDQAGKEIYRQDKWYNPNELITLKDFSEGLFLLKVELENQSFLGKLCILK